MDVYKELLGNYLADCVKDHIQQTVARLEFDMPAALQSRALQALEEIRAAVRKNDMTRAESDFETVEEILQIFGKYGISVGDCHDFG